VLYPQNGDRIVTIDSVTSLHPVYKIRYLDIYLFRVYGVGAGAASGERYSSYCETETFNASCTSGHVILMTHARYGRMRLNRSVVDAGGGEAGEAWGFEPTHSVKKFFFMPQFCSSK